MNNRQEILDDIKAIMVKNKIQPEYQELFLTAFAMGVTYAKDKVSAHFETNKLLGEIKV